MTVKELICNLQLLEPDTVITIWQEHLNSYYGVKVCNMQRAVIYPLRGDKNQYLLDEKGDVKMVALY